MTEQQAALIFFKIKVAFPFFDANEDAEVLWIDKLMKCGEQTALQNLDYWIENESKTPHIADIIKPRMVSMYDAQKIEAEQEQLMLQEYHQNNEVIPPPDHVYEMIESVMAKMKAGVPKDE